MEYSKDVKRYAKHGGYNRLVCDDLVYVQNDEI